MNANLSELIAALPEDDASSLANADWAQERLADILADLAQRPAPAGSLHRLWTLSELSAQIALAYAALWVRRWFADAEAARQRQMETNLRMALKIFHRLGYLRGAMTKLGQAAGSMPGILPDQMAEILDRLHFEAPPMHYPLIREVVRNEFGKEPEEMFLTFEREAFAAASLGQVHRARLKTGEPVAVKIQYPGIARTIDSDFRNLSALLLPLRLGKAWESAKSQFEEMRRMFNQEVDYVQEAESARMARELFRAEDGIVVPRVYAKYSGQRVLTADFIEGLHLPAYLATNPTQASRNAFGTKIYVAWQRMYYAGMPYGDPSPGNFLFLNDGRLGLIDFGCVQHYNLEERELTQLADRMAFEDRSLIGEVVRRACGVGPDDPEAKAYMQMMEESLDWMLEELRRPGPFDFGDGAHFRRGMDWFSSVTRKRLNRAHPMYVYWNRSIFGSKALLLRLRAQVDTHAVLRQERPGFSH
jgi:predicted unusual protein kinase regulating ubiquinone biosynthesis (AarF/ABC1/UbiB family)